MKKRIWNKVVSIFTAILLGLVPNTTITALAAETNIVYVGGVALTGSSGSITYATTNENGEVITEGATADNYNIKWDGSTLTLHNATIKTALEYSSGPPNSLISGVAIGVLNQSGDANLTITLEGDNTIDDVSQGIYVLAHSSTTGTANLTITGNGSLTTSGFQNGIRIQSNNGDATLSIQNAAVEATVTDWGDGIMIQSGESSNASLSVDGGSLMAIVVQEFGFILASASTAPARPA